MGPDGTLYVCAGFGGAMANWSGERILALDRSGHYVRTVAPFASNVTKDEAAGVGVIELEGRPAPLVKAVISRSFYGTEAFRKDGMAVTPDGVILRPVGGHHARGPLALSAIGLKGTAPWGSDVTPPLLDLSRACFNRPFVCVASDGTSAFISGTGQIRPDKKPTDIRHSCIWRVALPVKDKMTPFFGRMEEPGGDETHLSANPRGLAVDGKGNLLIADHASNRVVVVSEKDAKFVGQFACERPDGVAVDPGSGAVYVTRLAAGNAVELVKFRSWTDPTELAKLRVPPEGDPQHPWVMALDAAAKPPLVWMGSDGGSLRRIEDLGDKFVSTNVVSGQFGTLSFEDLSVDRFRPDREIYARIGAGAWMRFNEDSGKIERISTGTAINEGVGILAGPDGNLYGPAYAHNLFKFNRDGKPLPWREGYTGYTEERKGKDGKVQTWKGPAHAIFMPVSMVFLTHTMGIRQDGRIFMFEPKGPGDRPPKMLREYGLDGKRVSDTPIIWKVSDAAIGPRFDAAGNLYIAEQIKPADQPYPAEFSGVVGKVELEKTYLQSEPVKDAICTMYGSIVKFSPKGGMIHFGDQNPFEGEPKLDPSLKTMDMAYYTHYRFRAVKITGAEWVRMGVSHMDLHYCNCENIRFDVDEFGRTWYPDTARFRAGVLDTAGNAITQFGGYGNQDSCGPESKDKALAVPDLAVSWLISVGATDRYVYLGDSMNRRLLRAKIVYAAEESVEL